VIATHHQGPARNCCRAFFAVSICALTLFSGSGSFVAFGETPGLPVRGECC
jgi:hypothetical protein